MKKSVKLILMIMLIGTFIFSGICYAAQETSGKITKIFAFGDSLIDNGRANIITTEIMKNPNKPDNAYIKAGKNLYWNGRYSNGKASVEIFAEKLGVELENFAVGGALSGKGNYSSWMDGFKDTGGFGQVEYFKQTLKDKKADPNALYYIAIGANDYFIFQDYSLPGTPEKIANQTVDNISTLVIRLSKLGAKKFVVGNCPDVAGMPYEITYDLTKPAQAFTDQVNKRLPGSMKSLEKELNLSIMMFDVNSLEKSIKKAPKKYGLSELEKSYIGTWPEITVSFGEPDQYYYWDEWHTSRVVHKIVGEKVYQQVAKHF